MSTSAVQHDAELSPNPDASREWSRLQRIAFRFCFIYFTLYCLTNQIILGLFSFIVIEIPDPATHWPIKQLVTWVAAHVFRVTRPLVYFSGSGDKTFDWVLAFCLLLVSAIGLAIWSARDNRKNYASLHKWFRLFIRFALAGQMFGYGLAKVVPLQMPFPTLLRLIEPYGNFSPMGVLWYSVGASPAYEIFAGCAETLGGILLIFPRTTTLGALVCLVDLLQVFALNMTYDVPVKLFAFHLILMALLVLAPDARRLANFLLLDRAVPRAAEPALFASPRRNRIAVIAQVAFGIVLLGMNIFGSWKGWYQYGGGAPKSPLYGIWNVAQFSMNGEVRAPLLTDNDRWRRIVFEFPTMVACEHMDGTVERLGAKVNVDQKALSLTRFDDKNWKAEFTFQRPAPNRLILDGEMDHKKMHLETELVDRQKFLLVNRGFHWVQETPFNR
ncbi:MAG: DoxX family protein [Acidobacteria bacterium]|nr:DoxX family protein [Acidobacteriota bacterium]